MESDDGSQGSDGLVHRSLRSGKEHDRRAAAGVPARAGGQVRAARRGRGAHEPQQGAGIQQGGPGHQHPPHRVRQQSAHPQRGRQHRLGDLAVPRGARRGARRDRPFRRGPRPRIARRAGAAGRQGSLREGPQGRDPQLHRRLRSIRGAGWTPRSSSTPRRRASRRASPRWSPRWRAGGSSHPSRRDSRRRKPPDDDPHRSPTAASSSTGWPHPRRREEIRARAGSLPRLTLSARESADLDLIAVGAMSPLTGFMRSGGLRGRREPDAPGRRHPLEPADHALRAAGGRRLPRHRRRGRAP